MAQLSATDSSGNGREPSGQDTGITIGQTAQADGGKCWLWDNASSPQLTHQGGWLKVNAVTMVAAVKGPAGALIEMRDSTGALNGFTWYFEAGALKVDVRMASATGAFVNHILQSAAYPADGGWHMVGTSWDPATGRCSIWIDGVESSTTYGAGSGFNYQEDPPLRLGRQQVFAVNSFGGYLDEFACFAGVLLAARHGAYSNALVAGSGLSTAILADVPLAYWQFDPPSVPGWPGGPEPQWSVGQLNVR